MGSVIILTKTKIILIIFLGLIILSSLAGCSSNGDSTYILDTKSIGYVKINTNLPDGYSIRYPYISTEQKDVDELQKRSMKGPVGQIEILKGEEIVCSIFFDTKEAIEQTTKSEYWQMLLQLAPEQDPEVRQLTIIEQGTMKNGGEYIFAKLRSTDNVVSYNYYVTGDQLSYTSFCSLSEEEAKNFHNLLNIQFDHV